MHRLSQSFKWALRGIKICFVEEQNFKIEVWGALIVLALGLSLDITSGEFGLLILSSALVLLAEMVNTAIEDLCDKVEPKQDEIIGKVKDVMAGFVLIASFFASLVGVIILGPKVLELFS